MSKTLLIELHGFNRRYAESGHMPYLKSIADRYGMGSVIPPFGPDSLTSLWTGVYPNRHDQMFKFAYHGRKYNIQKILPYRFCNYLFAAYRILKGESFYTRLAPDKMSGYFSVHKRYHYCTPGAFGVRTLFDILKENQKTFLFYEHPRLATESRSRMLFGSGSDEHRATRFIAEVRKKPRDFYFLMLRNCDVTGHRFGPWSSEVSNVLRETDGMLKMILSEFDPGEDNIVIMSSYGMVPVTGHIDLRSMLPPIGKGYLYFLDSTFARFWFFDEKVKLTVLNILRDIEQGRVLSPEQLRAHNADFEHNEFGEVLFMVDYGKVISPNFFSEMPEKGMHTYDLSNKDGNEFGLCVSNRINASEYRVVDFAPTLLAFIGVSPEYEFDGDLLI